MATLSASLPSHPPGGKAPHRHAPAGRTLDALNFFLADVRDGLGPYLAIYLVAVRGPAHGWNEATVGLVLTIAGIVGLIAQTPAGQQRRVVDMDDGTVLSFGPNTGKVLAALSKAVYEPAS